MMTAKAFCYACLGIFLLVAAWTMGAQHAKADFDPTLQGHVIGFAHLEIDNGYAIRSDGTVWLVDYTGWHEFTPHNPLPVPVNQIKFYGGTIIVAESGQAWIFESGEWISRGQMPPPTVSAESSTWSGVKKGYQKE